jgi:hypothetical protein
LLGNVKQSLQDLSFFQLAESHNGATTLDWLDDFTAGVAGQCESGCAAVDLHRSSKRLLGAFGHAFEKE